jgi:hypothetical protein
MLEGVRSRVMETLTAQIQSFDLVRMRRVIDRSLLDEISVSEEKSFGGYFCFCFAFLLIVQSLKAI